MLKIINDLAVFFEDCYRRINVREYARIMRISPPTASKILSEYSKEGLLKSEKDRNYVFYSANSENKVFIELSRIYWEISLKDTLAYISSKLIAPTIVLFGSLSKAETKKDSDIDLCIIAGKKSLDLDKFERKLKRKFQVFWFENLRQIRNKNLLNNIINGYVLSGKLK